MSNGGRAAASLGWLLATTRQATVSSPRRAHPILPHLWATGRRTCAQPVSVHFAVDINYCALKWAAARE